MYQLFLDEKEDDDHRQGTYDTTRGEKPPFNLILPHHVLERNRDRPDRTPGKDIRKDELVPCGNEDIDTGSRDSRHRDGKDDTKERPQSGTSVNHRGVIELTGNRVEKTRHHPHGKGNRKGAVCQHQSEVCIHLRRPTTGRG